MMRAVNRFLPLLAIVPACALGGDDGGSVEQAIGGTASITLSSSSAAVTLTSDAQWALSKTGSVSGNTVTWHITATKTATVSGQLVVQGQLTVTNGGSGPATIGNIIVNLQTRVSNQWKSASVDIANATAGDGATTAKIHAAASSENKSSFTENSASGELEFMDATNNTVFSLVPEVSINPGQTRTLLFQASFNNNILHLATGTAIRAEVIVSFGNATANGNSTANVDINGNGSIDWDEHRIRSVPTRLTLSVPQQTTCNATPVLTDTLADIVGQGVTIGSVYFNLGATSGTVTAIVDGGTDGGTVTNCAHLRTPGTTVSNGGYTFTQAGAVDLEDCDTETISGSGGTCTPGTPNCAWTVGSLVTYGQVAWDSDSSARSVLVNNYSLYAPSGIVEIGIAGTGGFSARFSSANAIFNFLPATGASGSPLTADLNNPTSTAAGLFAGDVLALKLDVDFSASNALGGTSSANFGDLLLCDMTPSSLNNMTVSTYLAIVNRLLGGDTTTGYTINDLAVTTALLANAFGGGSVTTFAADHLRIGSCN